MNALETLKQKYCPTAEILDEAETAGIVAVSAHCFKNEPLVNVENLEFLEDGVFSASLDESTLKKLDEVYFQTLEEYFMTSL